MEGEKQKSEYRQRFKEFAIKERNEVFLWVLARTDDISIATGKEETWADTGRFIEMQW